MCASSLSHRSPIKVFLKFPYATFSEKCLKAERLRQEVEGISHSFLSFFSSFYSLSILSYFYSLWTEQITVQEHITFTKS
ncbi:hypothetical protein L1887_07361 [Cichorium endivia]|nr:hypothetical protein L1887_07361 [Cichorium endivia]